MTTISVPLPAELLQAIDRLITIGVASNKADAIRKAVQYYVEQQEVEEILRASREPRLKGDIDELAKKLT